MKKGRVYIAGPMTGMPNLNYPLFDGVALTLRLLGYEVENPADNGRDGVERSWREFMALGILQLLRCDTIVLLPGWQKSKGALIEKNLADALGMEVYEWRELTSQLAVGNSSSDAIMDSAAAAECEEVTGTTGEGGASVTSIATVRATGSGSAGRATRGRTTTRQRRVETE